MTTSTMPETPSRKNGAILDREIDDLNREFSLCIPNPKLQSPSSRPASQRSKEEQCHMWLKWLFYRSREGFDRALVSFREQVCPEVGENKQWVHKPNQDHGTIPSREDFLNTNGYRHSISGEERLERVDKLWKELRSEVYLARGEDPLNGSESPCPPRDLSNGPSRASDVSSKQQPFVPRTPNAKRKPTNDQEVFHTAPSSPTLSIEGEYPFLGNLDGYDEPEWNDLNSNSDTSERADDLKFEDQRFSSSKKKQTKITDHMMIAKSNQDNRSDINKSELLSPFSNTTPFSLPGASKSPDVSFATTVDSVFDHSESQQKLGTSFETTITEPADDISTQADSVEVVMESEEASMILKSLERNVPSVEQAILDDLLQNGPFSMKREYFSENVPLRARYELERTRQEWGVAPKQILVGDKPYEKYSDFWQWLEDVGRRLSKNLPEKPSIKAWDAATGNYEGERHSEAVILSGALDWCNKDEVGIFKLRLNPLKIERTCRFRRRFGSDRFLSITMPSPSKPPRQLGLKDQSSLRKVLTNWLVNNDHHLLRRRWRAFYVEEVKTKSKFKSGEPRVRVDLFAIDGSDFTVKFHAPKISPPEETCESRTRMTVDQLLQWHIPLDNNRNQTDCKLFSRIGLTLSKTWATVVLQPHQIRKLHDTPGMPVMNDGCALMSRPLARAICVELGIDGATPSCFQGRIAGAKGLWMVDRDHDDDETFWIEISDSQLKIEPHPRDVRGALDDEKLTFEVASWSKPLRPSELNTQLLEVLDSRGQVKARVAEIARTAIRDISMEFETVMDRNSIPLARALIQKIRPTPEDGSSRTNLRRVDQWILQNVESAIRFLEAGFSPRDFFPLQERLRICLSDTLNRYVNELHIPIPLSTYAYCIADPYGILEEDEVHFAFSSQWRDCSYFDDAMVDGVDVLVGRTPAHCPWDIQRRKAVWKPGLRHFKDVIVFSTKGTTPLASLLSGGDYDGDRPWICWDQGIVETFVNTTPPNSGPGPDHFNLVRHARPMSAVKSVNDLLQGAFEFNLAPSNLGRCTVEHENLAYEESNGLSSPLAIELAALLSHLVDSKKSGLQLTDEQWLQYRKSISPIERRVPAYKDQGAKRGKRTNINDYLRFEVALQEKEHALERFSQRYGIADEKRDEDLVRPWKEALNRAEREKQDLRMHEYQRTGVTIYFGLYDALKHIETRINQAYDNWKEGCNPTNMPIAARVQLAAGLFNRIQPPRIDHPLAHTWQNSEHEWQVLLASGTYFLLWRSIYPFYAAGETLCRIKTGNGPARLIQDQLYISMKFNSSRARRLAGTEAEDIEISELESDGDSDEFDRESVVDALLEVDRLLSNQQ